MFLPDFLSEARLQPGASCRAWTEATGCLDAVAWDRKLSTFPAWRAEIESARLRISDALEVQGIDPLGIFRSLLVHESCASDSRNWLRAIGFVHLESASGIHLYCAWNVLASFLRRMPARGRWLRLLVDGLRGILPPLLWFLVWSLSGFRPGLFRPLILVGVRFLAERRGIRFVQAAPILISLGLDALVAFVFSFGEIRSFSDWAPGELHYALSWWGGVLASEYGRKRGWSTVGMHLALSFGSWFAVLPIDLFEGRFSPATPILSFLTVECLARGGYAVVLGLGVATGAGFAGASLGLQWESVLSNRGLGWLAGVLSGLNLIRFT